MTVRIIENGKRLYSVAIEAFPWLMEDKGRTWMVSLAFVAPKLMKLAEMTELERAAQLQNEMVTLHGTNIKDLWGLPRVHVLDEKGQAVLWLSSYPLCPVRIDVRAYLEAIGEWPVEKP